MPFDAAIRDTLSAVTTATITTILLKKGLRNVWIRGTVRSRSSGAIPGSSAVIATLFSPTQRFIGGNV